MQAVSASWDTALVIMLVHGLHAALLQGSIPYVPFLRAPYYVWIGRVPQLATIMAESKTEAPSGFPATFLYTQSWEDPRPDMQVGKPTLWHSFAPSLVPTDPHHNPSDLNT